MTVIIAYDLYNWSTSGEEIFEGEMSGYHRLSTGGKPGLLWGAEHVQIFPSFARVD